MIREDAIAKSRSSSCTAAPKSCLPNSTRSAGPAKRAAAAAATMSLSNDDASTSQAGDGDRRKGSSSSSTKEIEHERDKGITTQPCSSLRSTDSSESLKNRTATTLVAVPKPLPLPAQARPDATREGDGPRPPSFAEHESQRAISPPPRKNELLLLSEQRKASPRMAAARTAAPGHSMLAPRSAGKGTEGRKVITQRRG